MVPANASMSAPVKVNDFLAHIQASLFGLLPQAL
jgi:hypothetical protein